MVKRDAKVLISKISREADVLDLPKSDNNTSDYRRLFPPICITNNFHTISLKILPEINSRPHLTFRESASTEH